MQSRNNLLCVLAAAIIFVVCGCGKPAEEKTPAPLPPKPPSAATPPLTATDLPWAKRLFQSPRFQMVYKEMLRNRADPLTELDFSASRLSREQRFRVSFINRPEPISLDTFQVWVIHIETRDGQPVSGAQISIGGGMPQHGHALPTKPRVTRELGNGDYRIEGIQFSMSGWWEFHVHVAQGNVEDTATFNVLIK